MTFGNRVLGSFCFALCCNHIIISITILQDLLQIMKEIKVEDIAFAICSYHFTVFVNETAGKKSKRENICAILYVHIPLGFVLEYNTEVKMLTKSLLKYHGMY